MDAGTKKTLKQLSKIRSRRQIRGFLSGLQNPRICEIGVRKGGHLKNIATPNAELVVGIDHWRNTHNRYENDQGFSQHALDGQYAFVFKETLKYNNVRLIRECSSKAALFFPDSYFDFVYIDADHSFEGTKRDLQTWYPKIKPGGVLSGHDYKERASPLQWGVIQAVTAFRQELGLSHENFHLTAEDYPSFFFVREHSQPHKQARISSDGTEPRSDADDT